MDMRALLLYGVWRVDKDARSGQRFLVAGWAFMCSMAFGAFSNKYTHRSDELFALR